MIYSKETEFWIKQMMRESHCPKKDIELLLIKYGLSKEEIEGLVHQRRINNSLFLELTAMEDLLKSKNKQDQKIENFINLFLQDFASKDKKATLKQLENVLSREGNILYLLNYSRPSEGRFTEKEKDIFLLREFMINYYANLHRKTTSINRTREETRLLKFLDMERTNKKNEHQQCPNFSKALLWLEIGSSKTEVINPTEEMMSSVETEKASATTREHCAKLYVQNREDGRARLAAGIVISGNYKPMLTMLQKLDNTRPYLEIKSTNTIEFQKNKTNRQFV